MKILIVAFFMIIANSGISQTKYQSYVDAFVAYEPFSNASISLKAIDVASGEVLMDYHSNTTLPPASTMKLFSTASAIDILGPNYQPVTSVQYDGAVIDSVLNGNIWIFGGGDMTLGSRYFNDENAQSSFLSDWVNSIRKAGIKQINGSIIADGSSFGYEGVPDGWSWSDIGNYYGAGFSGICIYDNMIQYHFQTKTVGTPAILKSTFPISDKLVFHNEIKSANVSGDNSYIYGSPFSYYRSGIGTLPANNADFVVKGSLPDPEEQLANELKSALEKNGISVMGDATPMRTTILTMQVRTFTPILEYRGKTISEIATITNHKSINLFAEGLMCLTGKKQIGLGSTSASTSYLETYWSKRINTSGLHIKDGSGLSRSNAVSASHYCDLLKSMHNSVNYSFFYNSLPISGKSGTLTSVCKNQAAHGKVHAKSGTMNRIKSYAGYIESNSGKTIAFAVIVNNYECSNSQTVDQMEKLFNTLVGY